MESRIEKQILSMCQIAQFPSPLTGTADFSSRGVQSHEKLKKIEKIKKPLLKTDNKKDRLERTKEQKDYIKYVQNYFESGKKIVKDSFSKTDNVKNNYVLHRTKEELDILVKNPERLDILNARINRINFDHSKFQIRRFHASIFIDGVGTEIQIDSGADVSLVSQSILENIDPDWQRHSYAGDISLAGVTGKSLKIITTKWLPISFTAGSAEQFMHPFVVVKDKSQFLLSSLAMYAQTIGIEWDIPNRLPYLTWPSRLDGRKIHTLLHSELRTDIAKNKNREVIKPGEEKIVEFLLQKASSPVQHACVYNVSNQLNQHKSVREVVISPSFSTVHNQNVVRALVKNFAIQDKIIFPGMLTANVELENTGNDLRAFSLDNESFEVGLDQFENEFHNGRHAPRVYIVSNLPNRVRKAIQRGQSLYSQSVSDLDPDSKKFVSNKERINNVRKTRDGQLDFDFEIPSRGKEPSAEDKEEMLNSIFTDKEDVADFSLEPGKDLGFDFGPPQSVWEQFDMETVRPQYRKFVRMLITKHEALFAKSDLDCGDISLTLGTYSLPLRKPLPTTNHRIYYMQGRKQQALKVILSMMLRHGLLKRVKSASFSSPVFLIDKKDPNSLPRLLADVRSLNEHLQGVQQIVPKIQSLLENVGQYKPVLFSTIDLASAFSSVVPDRKTERLLTLSTQFDLFSVQVGVQGVSIYPPCLAITSIGHYIQTKKDTQFPLPFSSDFWTMCYLSHHYLH